jgi:Domain of unknown function (DUF4157)
MPCEIRGSRSGAASYIRHSTQRRRRHRHSAPSAAWGTQREHPREQQSSTAASILGLQRLAGNQAVSDVLGAGRGRLSAEALRADQSVHDELAPALDESAERRADEVADRATKRLSGPLERTSGGGIPPELKRVLAPDLGEVGHLSLDDSAAAGERASSIGARAFADGARIAFAPGALDLSSREGVGLVAHEAAHATRDRSASGPGGTRLVHAKLAGTREAAVAMGGGATTKGIRKAFGLKTNWDKAMEGLGAYEALESAGRDGQPEARGARERASEDDEHARAGDRGARGLAGGQRRRGRGG